MKKAFSLVELMIVIIILGLLASLVMPNLVGKSEQAKQKLVCVQMKTLSEALKMFKIDMGSYPDTEESMEALIVNPDEEKYPNYPSGGYLDEKNVPKDPWNNLYIYLNDEEGIELISLGADGKEGGSGEDSDIRYTECRK